MEEKKCKMCPKRQMVINHMLGWSALWCSVLFVPLYFVQAGGMVFDLGAFVSWLIQCVCLLWCARIFFQSRDGWKRILEGRFSVK